MKVADLIGPVLDWAVARAESIPAEELKLPSYKGDSLFRYTRDEDGELDGYFVTGPDLLFSTKWEAGGPIIEREWLHITPWPNESNRSTQWQCQQHDSSADCISFGSTPLIAAMRCYVASKFGDEVDIPEALK